MWQVYILRCADGTLYTGSTNDVEKRLAAHNAGRGAKYTRARRPCALVYVEEAADKGAALRREAAIKRLTRTQKLRLMRPNCMRKGAPEPGAFLALGTKAVRAVEQTGGTEGLFCCKRNGQDGLQGRRHGFRPSASARSL